MSFMPTDFPTAGFPYDDSYNGGYHDVFVSKLDSSLSVLIASTFLGGSGSDYGNAIALDSSNNVYVAGSTSSTDFPTAGFPYDDSYNRGNNDVFVSKFDSSLSALIASTFLGGASSDRSGAIALDSNNNVYVVGPTSSNILDSGYEYPNDFPTAGSPYDGSYNGGGDVFLSKLDSSLSTLIASTFLGGSGHDRGYAFALDSSNNVYVTGYTASADFPTTGSPYDANNYIDVFVSKLDSDLSTLIASTFLGGSGSDLGNAIALDSSNNVYVTGNTWSTDFPTAGSPYDYSHNDDRDVFVSKLDSNLSTLIASTFLGGASMDFGNAIVLDSSNNVYVAGYTWSTDFPTAGSPYDSSYNGGFEDAFVSKLDSSLSTLIASTFLGGARNEHCGAIALDSSNNVYVVGSTTSTDFPTAGSPYDDSFNGSYGDVFVSKLELFQLPETTTIADIDGSGQDDIIIDFGSGFGIWIFMNNSEWMMNRHTLSPETMTTGDIDGGGKDDIILDFGPSYGIWIQMNNSTLVQLHILSPEAMITGDIDGGGLDDIILDFGGLGTWVRMNNSSWVQLHSLSPEAMITGDIDGGGKDDIILDYGSLGTWVRMNNSSWVQLHTRSPEAMTTGDIDGGGKDDIILDFGGLGTWVRMNNITWAQLHSLSPEAMITEDIDGGGKDDIILDFGGLGTWVRMNNITWAQLHSLSPETMTTGDIDGGGSADVILDFGSLGTWTRMNNSSWSALPKP